MCVVLSVAFNVSIRLQDDDWSFAEKTFVKQSMMLCAFEILLKIGRFGEGGVNRTDDLGYLVI